MHAHHTPREQARFRDLGYPDDRGVGSENDLRRNERLHLLEQSALGLEVLEDALEDEIGAVQRLGQIARGGEKGDRAVHLIG